MGIINVTPDSFSDGNTFSSTEEACDHALRLVEQGADIIDIGGESSRPNAVPVPLDLELNRVIPIIEYLHKHSDVCISIDTYKPEVMKAAVIAGADMINDIYALRAEGALNMAKRLNVPICLLHMQGHPHNMQHNPQYPLGVLMEVREFFAQRIDACIQVGIPRNRLLLDIGFGFGKKVEDNLRLVKNIADFQSFKIPLLLGLSRKSTIGAILNKDVRNRLIGSIALGVYALIKGIDILRVHDVDETNQALMLLEAVNQLVE